MTQQQLAVRMGLSIVTITRWEGSRPPQGHYLLQLAGLAKTLNRPDLYRIFVEAVRQQATFIEVGSHVQAQEATKDALFWLTVCAGPFDYMGLSPRFVEAYRAAIRAIKTAHFELLREVREGGSVGRAVPRHRLEATQLLLEQIDEQETLRSNYETLRGKFKEGSDESQ